MVRHGSLREERERVRIVDPQEAVEGPAATRPSRSAPVRVNGRQGARETNTRGDGPASGPHEGRPMHADRAIPIGARSGAREVTFSGGISEASGEGCKRQQSGSDTDFMSQASRDLSMSGLAKGSFLPSPPFDTRTDAGNDDAWCLLDAPSQPDTRIPSPPPPRYLPAGEGPHSPRRQMTGKARLLIEQMRAGLPSTKIPRVIRRRRSPRAADAHGIGPQVAPQNGIIPGFFSFMPVAAPQHPPPALVPPGPSDAEPERTQKARVQRPRGRTVAMKVPAAEEVPRGARDSGPGELSGGAEPPPDGPRGSRGESIHWRRQRTLSSMKSLSRMGTVSFMHGMAILGVPDEDEGDGADAGGGEDGWAADAEARGSGDDCIDEMETGGAEAEASVPEPHTNWAVTGVCIIIPIGCWVWFLAALFSVSPPLGVLRPLSLQVRRDARSRGPLLDQA